MLYICCFCVSGALFIDLTRRNNRRQRGTPGGSRGLGQRTPQIDFVPVSPLQNRTGSTDRSTGSRGNSGILQNLIDSTMNNTAISAQSRVPTKDDCLSRQRELWCDPVGPWDDTPGVARWCLLNCRSDNCDNTRCSCRCIDETLFTFRYEQISLRAP